MSSSGHTPAVETRAGSHPPGRRLQGAELAWAFAFLVPYVAVFAAFVVYPVGYGLWMARDPALFGELFAEPRYVTTAINTLLFVGFGVNVMMFCAVLLSGFFMRRQWWVRATARDLTCSAGRCPPFPLSSPSTGC